MNANEFKKLVNKYFSPNIRQLGWKGSGFHFYKHDPNHVVNIFGIQGAWYGGSVTCETAIHFDFIPDLAHKEIDISKTSYASCIIRKILSPKGDGDHSWTFRNNEDENIKSVNQIWDAFKTHGKTFYNDFINFPYPFDTIMPQDLKAKPNYKLLDKYYIYNSIHFAWLLKEVNLFIGRQEIAKDFSIFGLSQAIENSERMTAHSKSKKAMQDIANYIDTNKKMFAI
ncbi:MAG: DUF4304 domain-containing protein [Bacteroidetes bacterium]|nr:DUF4304 domain-containing protein [Bacteroidota bacterium]